MFYRIILITLLLALGGCQTSSNVVTDYDTTADFHRFHSYQWARQQAKHGAEIDPLIISRTHSALELQLLLAGIDPVKAGARPDLLVHYQVISTVSGAPPRARGGVGIGHASGGSSSRSGVGLSMSFPIGEPTVAERATIIIDFLDGTSEKLVWRGSATINLSGQSPSQRSAAVEKTVAEIIAQYPPN